VVDTAGLFGAIKAGEFERVKAAGTPI